MLWWWSQAPAAHSVSLLFLGSGLGFKGALGKGCRFLFTLDPAVELVSPELLGIQMVQCDG